MHCTWILIEKSPGKSPQSMTVNCEKKTEVGRNDMVSLDTSKCAHQLFTRSPLYACL